MGQKSRSAQLAELQAVDDRLKAQGDPRAKRRLERQARAEQPSEPKRQRVRCDWRQELRDDYLDARSTACQHCLTCDAEVRGPQAPVSLPGCRSCTTSSRATVTTSRQARCERHGGGQGECPLEVADHHKGPEGKARQDWAKMRRAVVALCVSCHRHLEAFQGKTRRVPLPFGVKWNTETQRNERKRGPRGPVKCGCGVC